MKEAICFWNTDFQPYHTAVFTELRGDGWKGFETSMQLSHGSALLLMHPWYSLELDWLANRGSSSERASYARYESHLRQTIERSLIVGLPIIMYIDTTLQPGGSNIRTNDKIRHAIDRYENHITSSDIQLSHPIFYIPTAMGTHEPLLESEYDFYDSRDEALVSDLEKHGLSYVVVGGMRFGGDNSEAGHDYCSQYFYKVSSHNRSRVGNRISQERQAYGRIPKSPHPLEVAHMQENISCIAGLLDVLMEYSFIRFRIGRGITYPQQVPLMNELEDLGETYRWNDPMLY